MDVSLLYFDGCPNHHDIRVLLNALLNEAGWDGTLQMVNVDSPERAEELEFRGPPTVLINGDDPPIVGVSGSHGELQSMRDRVLSRAKSPVLVRVFSSSAVNGVGGRGLLHTPDVGVIRSRCRSR